MEITYCVDTLHSVYNIPCNLEGEPVFGIRFKPMPHIKYGYEVRDRNCFSAMSYKSIGDWLRRAPKDDRGVPICPAI